jgi:subtilisin
MGKRRNWLLTCWPVITLCGFHPAELRGAPLWFCRYILPDRSGGTTEGPRVLSIEPDRIVSIASCFTVVDPGRITWVTKRVGYGDGTGKTAWIIDAGIDVDHPDLNVDKERSVSYVNGKTFDDDNGHGTHVAGIIGAKNNREGIMGVASNARLVSLKVMNEVGEGQLSNVMVAVGHVYRNGKPGDIVNLTAPSAEAPSSTAEVFLPKARSNEPR